ncbi:unnamed protein product, partial [Didymodactylos carnosus]
MHKFFGAFRIGRT